MVNHPTLAMLHKSGFFSIWTDYDFTFSWIKALIFFHTDIHILPIWQDGWGFNTVLCIILDPKDCLVMTNMSFLGNITLDWWAPFDQCKQWCLNTTSCYGIINESNKRCTTFRYDAESKNNLNTEDWENMQIMHKSKWCLECGRKLWKRMVFLISVFIAEIDWKKSN